MEEMFLKYVEIFSKYQLSANHRVQFMRLLRDEKACELLHFDSFMTRWPVPILNNVGLFLMIRLKTDLVQHSMVLAEHVVVVPVDWQVFVFRHYC